MNKKNSITNKKFFFFTFFITNDVYIPFHFVVIKAQTFVIRPLLGLNREEIKYFIHFLNLPIYPDNTNELVKYSRNRIRKQLIPAIRFFFNPKLENSLFKFSDVFNGEQLYIDSLVNKFIRKKKSKFQNYEKKGQDSLFYNDFFKKPYCINRKILKIILEKKLKKNVKFLHIETYLTQIVENLKGKTFFDEKNQISSFILKTNYQIKKKLSKIPFSTESCRSQTIYHREMKGIFYPKIGFIVIISQKILLF